MKLKLLEERLKENGYGISCREKTRSYFCYELGNGLYLVANFADNSKLISLKRYNPEEIESVEAEIIIPVKTYQREFLDSFFRRIAEASKNIHGFNGDIGKYSRSSIYDPHEKRHIEGPFLIPYSKIRDEIDIHNVVPMLKSLETCKYLVTKHNGSMMS